MLSRIHSWFHETLGDVKAFFGKVNLSDMWEGEYDAKAWEQERSRMQENFIADMADQIRREEKDLVEKYGPNVFLLHPPVEIRMREESQRLEELTRKTYARIGREPPASMVAMWQSMEADIQEACRRARTASVDPAGETT